jgi:pimeloyl-ACP methyl ester carboxylesterase
VIPPTDLVHSEGSGPDLVLVHGTASDAASWHPLVRLLRGRARVTRYDRRGTAAWPAGAGETPLAADHASDLADLVARHASGSVHLFGASFGGVVALELTRSRPELVRSATLFEPALAAHEGAPEVPSALLAELEKWLARGEPERAAETFHRRVLTDALWERLPAAAKQRARGLWPHIRADLVATVAYRARHAELARCETRFLLLRGGRSPEAFEAPLRALAAALPHARRALVAPARHQSFGAAWHDLADQIGAFLEEG